MATVDPIGRELPLLLVGTDHHTAPLELRERVAYDHGQAEEALVHLIAQSEIEEALLLSTCNRTEVYVRHHDQQEAFQRSLDLVFVARAPEIKQEGRYYVKGGPEAVRHLLRVASGLESMILGEPEILGQVKQAAGLAESLGSAGAVLRRLARSASVAGSRARTETGITSGAVSFGYAAVELARSIFTSLDEITVLVLGAGETSVSVARALLEKGAQRVRIANRSRERAEAFCSEFPQAEVVPFEERYAALADADLVVAATSAPEAILRRGEVESATRHRRSRPLLVVDLGVPRDIEAGVGELGNVFLHDVDSLQQLIDRNLRRRRDEVPRVSQIVDEELERFELWFGSLAAAPVVAQLHRRAENIRRRELHLHRDRFPEHTHGELEALTRSIVRKILHHPSVQLREAAEGENLHHLAALKDLFLLDDESDD